MINIKNKDYRNSWTNICTWLVDGALLETMCFIVTKSYDRFTFCLISFIIVKSIFFLFILAILFCWSQKYVKCFTFVKLAIFVYLFFSFSLSLSFFISMSFFCLFHFSSLPMLFSVQEPLAVLFFFLLLSVNSPFCCEVKNPVFFYIYENWKYPSINLYKLVSWILKSLTLSQGEP